MSKLKLVFLLMAHSYLQNNKNNNDSNIKQNVL